MTIGPARSFLLITLTRLSAAEFQSPPVVVPNPNPAVPLAAIVRFSVATPVETIVTLSDGERKWDVRFDPCHNPGDGLLLVGMHPGKKHEIRIQIRDRAGKITRAPQPLEFTTPALPDGGVEFPPIQVNTSNPKQMEPGWTLLSVRGQRGGGALGEPVFALGYGLILALDEQGQVVWYYRGPNPVRRRANRQIAIVERTRGYRI
jgi:arylsulfate sulfotransferase